MRKSRKNVSKSVRKNRNIAVMRVFVVLALVAVFVWYLVKKFAKRGRGTSFAASLGGLTASQENLGGAVIPQGETQIEAIHGFNNPGNITYNPKNEWYGQAGFNIRTIGGKQYRYCNFESLYAGVRAMFICVNNVYQRLFGVDLSQGIGTEDYLTYCESMRGKVAQFYETYSGQSGSGAGCASVFAQMVNSTDKPLTALCMAVYKMEAGVNYDKAVMDEIASFQYERVF